MKENVVLDNEALFGLGQIIKKSVEKKGDVDKLAYSQQKTNEYLEVIASTNLAIATMMLSTIVDEKVKRGE